MRCSRTTRGAVAGAGSVLQEAGGEIGNLTRERVGDPRVVQNPTDSVLPTNDEFQQSLALEAVVAAHVRDATPPSSRRRHLAENVPI